MGLREPTNVSECLYFTRRAICSSEKLVCSGSVKAWVFKEPCVKCKGKMQAVKPESALAKPREYSCESCGYKIDVKEYEESLLVNIQYTCPKCNASGELQIPYVRKKIKIFNEEEQKEKTADAIQFNCQKCNEKINITKKMK